VSIITPIDVTTNILPGYERFPLPWPGPSPPRQLHMGGLGVAGTSVGE